MNHGADICNVSLQYYLDSGGVLESAVAYAVANNVLVIAAAGNHDLSPNPVAYPAKYDGAMAISGTTDSDLLASWSNYGAQVDVCAPGDAIYSTWAQNGSVWMYNYDSGTSMSSPHVAGLAALVKSYVPGLTASEIRGILTGTADDLGTTGWDQYFGYGRINAHAALLAADAETVRIVSSDPPDGAIDARQPSNTDGSEPAGWAQVELVFDGVADALLPGDFSVEVEGAGSARSVTDVLVTSGSDTVTLLLNDRIEPGCWTTIRHDFSGTAVRLGYLPGDADNDETSAPADILAVIDGLNGVTALEVWQSDMDRDGTPAPADILRTIDLLNGAASYDPWLNVTLP